jgi:hypothetical protein
MLEEKVQPSWSEGGATRHNFGRGPSNDYFIKVWFQLNNWFQTRRLLTGSWEPMVIFAPITTQILFIKYFYVIDSR